MKKVQNRSIQLLALATGLMLLLAGCQKHESTTAVEQGKALPVSVVTVAFSTVPQVDETPGSVVSEHQVQVASRLMGYIRDIRVNEGENVKAGQLLFSIDPTDIQGQVNQAEAGLAQADAALADAKADYERFSNLYKDESVSRQQYDKIKMMYHVAQSQAAAAHAGLNTAQSQMRYAEVRAPISGVVTQKLASSGELAAPGRPVLVVENQASLQIQTSVSDETYSRLKLGNKVEVIVDGHADPLKATISRLVGAADQMSHTHMVKLNLDRIKGLRSGAFASVRFVIGSRQGIRVPLAAVLQRAGISGVFVVDELGVAHYRMVTVGTSSSGEVEIQAGLNLGDRVVVAGGSELDSGDLVKTAESTKP
jgi:RND family efflux transporter MFP subunit